MKNIVFVVADQLRADIAYHETYPFVRTPQLDRLRREGITLRNAFCQYPICAPSRASFLTGRYPQQIGVLENRSLLPPEERTLGHHLRDNGFEAVAFGKTHGQNPGFRRFPEPPLLESLGATDWGWYTGQSMLAGDSDRALERRPLIGVFSGAEDEHYDFRVANQIDTFLANRDHDRPLAMFVGFHTPHPPLIVPKAFSDLYPPETLELFEVDEEPSTKPPMQQRVAEPWLKTPESVRKEMVAAYLAQVTLVDTCLGRVMASLEERDLLENTLIVFISDHGEQLGEHNMIGKFHSFYEGSLRVPTVLRLPDSRHAGTEPDGLVELVDLLPTIYDLLGVAAPYGLAGKSLRPTLEDPGHRHRNFVYSTLLDRTASGVGDGTLVEDAVRGQMVRNHQYKLAVYTDGWGELYDLKSDPREHVNRYQDPVLRDVKLELLEMLVRHWGRYTRTPPLWGYNYFPG